MTEGSSRYTTDTVPKAVEYIGETREGTSVQERP